jgi:hypothetical protein
MLNISKQLRENDMVNDDRFGVFKSSIVNNKLFSIETKISDAHKLFNSPTGSNRH